MVQGVVVLLIRVFPIVPTVSSIRAMTDLFKLVFLCGSRFRAEREPKAGQRKLPSGEWTLSKKWEVVTTRQKGETWVFRTYSAPLLICGVKRDADEPLCVGPGTEVYGLFGTH